MSDILEKIIDYLTRDRVSTTEVADALGKTGVLPDVFPINRGHYRAGVIKWVYAYNESNWTVHEQIRNIDEDCIVLVEAFDCNNRAILGELVSKYILLYRQCKALVVCGNTRDASHLIAQNWPIWCQGFNPVGCFNKQLTNDLDISIKEEHLKKYDGAIAVCDDCGVVIIPKEKINKEFFTISYSHRKSGRYLV